MFALPIYTGTEGSAAGGGCSDPREWQGSIKTRTSASPQILSGTATGYSPGNYRRRK